MKSIVGVFLASLFIILLAVPCLGKKRVILIGIDGLNPSCIEKSPFHENLDWLIQNGAYTFKARTIIQAVSAPGWAAITCSLDPTNTGILDNEWIPPWNHKPNPITPLTGNEKPFPCIFEAIKSQDATKRTAFLYDWDWLKNLGNENIKGNYIDSEIYCDGPGLLTTYYCDWLNQKKVNEMIRNLEENDLDFIFTYFNGLDDTGHGFGWCSFFYKWEISVLDHYIGNILKSLKVSRLLEETYIFVISDHGGRFGAYGHGEQNDSNLFVPFIAVGPGIKKNYLISDVNVHNMDVAPTIMKILGLKPHEKWRGRVVEEVFE